MKTKRRVVVTVILSAILVAAVLFAQLWSRSFYDFAHLDRATQLYIHSARNIEEPIPQVILENQEFQPLVDVLGSATVRFNGRSRLLRWDAKENMYDLYFRHFENDEPVLDADVSLCSDGMMYVHLGSWFGYLRYRLEDCDIDTVAAVLDELLAID